MSYLRLRENRMVTQDTPYSFELQAYYNHKTKSYSFPLCGDILRRIPNYEISQNLRTLLQEFAQGQARCLTARSNKKFSNDRMYDYQKSGANWLIEIRKGILADDQGAGKTITSLGAAKELDLTRVLIICSKNKRDEWVDETLTWTGQKANIYSKKTPTKWSGYLIANYDSAVDNVIQMSKAALVIIDEAHILRNRKTRMFKQIRKIARKAKFLFLLTASPSVNEISDFWTLLCMCDEKRFGSYWGFAFRFCEIMMDGIGMKVGNTKEEEKDNLWLILNNYVLSRMNETVLPDPEWVVLKYNLSTTQRELYNQMDSSFEAVHNSDKLIATTSLSQITRLRQISLHPGLIFPSYNGKSKLDLLPEIIKKWEGQTLIFAQYAELIKMSTKYLCDQGIQSIHLVNDLTEKRRATNISMFRKGDFQVLAMTYKMGGEGLNFPVASQVIFLEYAWNPATMRHAYKRVLREGQLSDRVRLVIIHASETIEDHIYDILKDKQKVTVGEVLRRKG